MVDTILNFLKTDGIFIAIVLVSVYFARKFSMIAASHAIKHVLKAHNFSTARDRHLREKTLVSIFGTGLRVLLWITAGMLILDRIGVNIAPFLAGASIVGIAIGFGAQTLFKDLIAGFFILIENQYRVGDVVRINLEIAGTVEELSLRSTTLRNLDGEVHHIANSEIKIATNMTMDYANVNLNIIVDYDNDIDLVEKIINEVGLKMFSDVKWAKIMIEAPQFLRVNDFKDGSVEVKITGKTQPMEQWTVMGEFRRRLKVAFDDNNVSISFPQVVVHQAKHKK